MNERPVQLSSGPLTLEGVWHVGDGKKKSPCVVVCHPHTLYGGDMDNGIVVLVCRELARNGINAFRFNFRGAGGSQGSFGGGVEEQEDLKAALSFVESSEFVDPARIGVCGYSFGAGVVLSAAPRQKNILALAAISPPLSYGSQPRLEDFRGSKLFLGGSEDTLFSPEDLSRFVETLPEPRECQIIPGADHFWFGFEREIAKKVASFFARALNENR